MLPYLGYHIYRFNKMDATYRWLVSFFYIFFHDFLLTAMIKIRTINE